MRNSIGKKLLLGALIGWGVAFLLIFIFAFGAGYPIGFLLFLSLAPGVITGIIVTYIINKENNKM